MRYLLDTHVWIWAFEGSAKIGAKCRKVLGAAAAERFVSPVSAMEIARLVARGEIELVCPLQEWVARSMSALKLQSIELDNSSAIEAYALPEPFHPDPADRLLVATARVHDLRFVTADRRILAYSHVDALSARA
jgi:PIN domain nuclease of toxin-antitoxin system